MEFKTFTYPVIIREGYLDTFGHMNNAEYLILFEEARWDMMSKQGYGLNKISETAIGPTILEIKINFLKEIKVREKIIIETKVESYKGKVCKLIQKMLRENDVCCTAEFTIALIDLKKRKIISPTEDWLNAVGKISE